MPRPGPRPYECVRRAWHSDRHQPMRGSLIQEIFRVVNEIHSPASKKNKEWQEKLPIVVLKAEEIMYSKANSEAEYMDFKTVLKRTNDAIDVIIRRDESTESGDLLHPCIEAALNLGCIPRRASRSQRLSNPRFYLSSSPHETAEASVPPKISGSTTFRGSHPLQPQSTKHVPHTSPQYASYYSTRLAPFTVNSTRIGSQPTPLAHANLPSGAHNQFLLSSENLSLSQQDNHSCSMDVHPSTSFGHAYPLYYGTTHTALVQPVLEPKTSFLQNFTSCNTGLDGCSKTIQPSLNLGGTSEYRPRVEFDLSLRLGSLSAPSPSMEDKWNPAVEDVGFPTSCDATRLCDLSLRTRTSHFDCPASPAKREKEFCFFPTADHSITTHPSGQSSSGHGLDVETAIRKHKAPTDGCGEDLQLYWQMNPSSSQFFGRTKRSNS